MGASPRSYAGLELNFGAASPSERAALEEVVAVVLDDSPPIGIEERGDRWLACFGSEPAREAVLQALADRIRGFECHRASVAAWEIASCRPPLSAALIDVIDDDWAAKSQARLSRVVVGGLVVAPPWDVPLPSAKAGPTVIVIEPSMGFGTGHHASTRLCLELLQALDLGARRVLDVGTGSGVLAIAAAMLGAASVVAIDRDPDAIESARGNLGRNGLAEATAAAEPGGQPAHPCQVALAVRDIGDFAGGAGPLEADIVLANLTGAALVRHADHLVCAVSPGGHLVLGGLQTSERPRVVDAFVPPLALVSARDDEDWSALVLAR